MPKDIYAKFDSHETGLIATEIAERQIKYGVNEITGKPPEPLWRKALRQFTDLLVLILIGAGLLALFSGETTDAIVILSIVFLNAAIGFAQEYKTERALAALKNLTAPEARVLRAGKEALIPARELVPGDVIILTEGMKVPADAHLVEANELKVEQAALTGESMPVYKTAEHTTERFGDMVLSGTNIASGSGRAIVLRIGMQTEFGKVAKLTTETTKEESPLTKEMQTIGAFVGKVSLAISAILVGIGMYQGRDLAESVLFAVAVAVAAVPEGLPVTITAALALGVRRLAKQKALMRELRSVETLGATTVICSDKTGTLTENQMTVVQGWLPGQQDFTVTGSGYDPTSGEVQLEKQNHAAQILFTIADRCNEAKLVEGDNPDTTETEDWHILGDPTEGALRVVARKFGIVESVEKPLKDFPFDSERKRMSIIFPEKNRAVVYAKGAPEQILSRATHYLDGQQVKLFTPELKRKILVQNEVLAGKALRVLALAYRELESRAITNLTPETAEDKLIFVGLLGLIDPPRPEVAHAVELCGKAGIRIIIVTGDNGITARAIAEDLKLADATTPITTGDELAKMPEPKLKKLLSSNGNLIFARMQPADKLRIVNAYKDLNEVVAVTGDGVNDAPALKRADIGVAMGITGTDVAKEAASMVLVDDSFASIVTAVKEGRQIYANMRKFVLYIFSCNIGELFVIFAAIILAVPAPLTAILILLVDLGTDVLPSLALGVDPVEPDIMQRKPRDPAARMLTGQFVWHFLWLGLIIGSLVLGGYFYVLIEGGWVWGQALDANSFTQQHAATFAFATLVIIQLFNAFNFRSERYSILSPRVKVNYSLWGAVLVSVLLVVAVVELPFLQLYLGTTALSLVEWGILTAIAASVIVVEELRKTFARIVCCKPLQVK